MKPRRPNQPAPAHSSTSTRPTGKSTDLLGTGTKRGALRAESTDEDAPTQPGPSQAEVPSLYFGVIIFDENFKIVSANHDSSAMFGWPELSGKEVAILLRGGLNNEFGRLLQRSYSDEEKSQRFSLRVVALRKGGEEFPSAVILTRTVSGAITSWTAVFQELVSSAHSFGHAALLPASGGGTPTLLKPVRAEAAAHAEEMEKLRHECETLEEELQDIASAKAELERQVEDHVTIQADLEQSLQSAREQLTKARATADKHESAYRKEADQCDRLKQELVCQRQLCDELTDRITAEQQDSERVRQDYDSLQAHLAETQQNLRSLQSQLEEKSKVLGEIQTSLEERSKACDELQGQLDEKTRALEEAQATPVAGNAEQLAAELRQLREKISFLEVERTELDQRARESAAAVARLSADLEKERRERRRKEQRAASLATQLEELHNELKEHLHSERTAQDLMTELEQKLQEHESSVARLKADLQKEQADRQLAEQQIQAAQDMKDQLEQYRSLFEESKATFQRTREDLESRLQSNLKSLREKESRLEKEITDRQRAEEMLALVRRDLTTKCEQNALEIARLTSELQVEQLERKRLESDAATSRYASLDSTRNGRALVNNLRSQVQSPVDTLLQTTRTLLEEDLPDTQKKLAESILESALLVQTTVRDAAPANVLPAPTAQEKPDSGGPVPQAA